jgi:chromosome segregation ATPase
MDRHLTDQLDKVIAMADSSHDGEAVVAVRKARQMLLKGGLRFSDLAQAAEAQRSSLFTTRPAMPGITKHLEIQLTQLRQRLDNLQNNIQSQDTQLEFWRRRALNMEHALNAKQKEAERWKNLARDTVDKLWDLSETIRSEEDKLASLTAKSKTTTG